MTRIGDFDTITLDERYTIMVETRTDRANRDGEYVVCWVAKHWWLLDNGTPVAFLKTLFTTGGDDQHGGCPLVLCDIEVRATHRGQGLTHRIVEAVEAIEGMTVWTSGGFTPLGAQALSWLPVYPWNTGSIQYDNMVFVEDWANLQAKFHI